MYILKRALTIIAAVLLIMSFTFATVSAAAECESWYVRRNGARRPVLQRGQEMILKYDAYYLDMGVTDDSDDRVLYLTFDAGYANDSVVSILDTLRGESVPAAFFVLDNIIAKNTDLVTRMTEDGHLVCNHTKNHKNLLILLIMQK